MAVVSSICTGGIARSLHQMDRGARIRSFRELRTHGDATNNQDVLLSGDTNGKIYTQALQRLSTFRVRHKNKAREDAQRIDWQDEDMRLGRVNQELTKAITDMLRASSTKRSCPPTSTLACRKDNFAASAKCTVHSQASRAENRKRQPIEQHCTACVQDTEGTHHMFTSTTEELADLNSEEQELEIERQKDLDRDASQVVELRALVTEFVNSCKALRLEREEVPSLSGYSECLHPQRNGENVEEAATSTIAISSRVVDNPLLSNGARESALMRFRPPRDEANNKGSSMAESAESRQGIMADILLQVRTAHSEAGDSLSKKTRELEAEVKDARRALAVILVPDYEQEGACSVEAWVLDSIENSLRNSRAQEKRPSTEDTGGGDDGKGIMHGGDDEVRRAIIRAQVIVRLGMIEAEHSTRLATLRHEFLRNATQPNSAGSTEAALHASGGWNPEEHFRFTKVLKARSDALGDSVGAFGTSSGGGRPGGNDKRPLTVRLCAGLPDMSPDEISRHETWVRQRGLFVGKKKIENERRKRELDDLVAWGKASLEAQRQGERAAVVRAEELREREARRAELEALLRDQRETRNQRKREQQEREREATQSNKSREAAAEERKAWDDERKRKLVAEYRASLHDLRVREADARAAEERAREIERIQRMPKNRERIGFREERARLKREEQDRRAREAQALEAKRLEVLGKLALSVPYAAACANAEAKLDHITAATAAHFDQLEHFDRSRGHCPMFGYNTGKVFRNARFRLGLYLREAGVSHTTAAHEAVMRSVGPLPDAPF